jgi:hypothetical protein
MMAHSVMQETAPGRASAYGIGILFCAITLASGLSAPATRLTGPSQAQGGISKPAAESCAAKVQRLENYAATTIPAASVGKRATRLTEDELNSYLELDLRPGYHPSLKSIRVKFTEGRLQGAASIDFDLVELKNTSLLTGLLRKMLTGVHSLVVLGGLNSGEGKAQFRLDEARFDGISLPNLLVAEIITVVCHKQNPPFDPMKPSALPYRIQKVDLHAGYLVVYQ